jgi:hypothetical protein
MSRDRDYQVGLLTGPSDRLSWALSPQQQEFLDTLVPRDRQIAHNFPYARNPPPYRRVPLLRASLSNARAYVQSRSAEFCAKYRAPISQEIARREATVLIAGSCGLEIFNNLRLPPELLRRTRLFAYGPVARRRPDCPHRLVGGRYDALSRWFFPRPDQAVDCSHLDYLSSPEVRDLCLEFIAEGLR